MGKYHHTQILESHWDLVAFNKTLPVGHLMVEGTTGYSDMEELPECPYYPKTKANRDGKIQKPANNRPLLLSRILINSQRLNQKS